jgi:SRSO17 transposase
MADHDDKLSHDKVMRGLRTMTVDQRHLWEKIQPLLQMEERGYIIFDDTVIDKNHSHKIEMVRRQYSGNAKGLVKGIGVVNCVYVNSKTGEENIIDYRIFNPQEDGKTKVDHVLDMLEVLVNERKIEFRSVLMDTWYATQKILLKIEEYGKVYYCPLKSNRLGDDSDRKEKMKNLSKMEWNEKEEKEGKMVHIKEFPNGHKMRLFRIEVSTNRTDFVATNSLEREKKEEVRQVCAIRWKIEQSHRELKQLTGIEKCQSRKKESQKSHIGCAMLVLCAMKEYARKINTTVYQLKEQLLKNYMIQELNNPSINLNFA